MFKLAPKFQNDLNYVTIDTYTVFIMQNNTTYDK